MSFSKITVTMNEEEMPDKEFTFEEKTQCIIGRAHDCDIQVPPNLAHADVSRHHCLLEIDPPALSVRDLGSKNGTYVNGEMIGQRLAHEQPEDAQQEAFAGHELHDGDEIRIGHLILRIGIASRNGRLSCQRKDRSEADAVAAMP
jgi:pSer/pThr/pTyr-binding forkhead associated (FHA) protein